MKSPLLSIFNGCHGTENSREASLVVSVNDQQAFELVRHVSEPKWLRKRFGWEKQGGVG